MSTPHPGLRSSMLWTLSGNLVFAATQWGMLVLLARLGSRETLGLYALGLAVTTPVFLLLSLQLRGAQATEPMSSPYRFGHYFTLRTVLSLAALALCLGYALSRGGQLAPVIAALALAKLLDSLSDVCYGQWQAQGHLAQISRSLMLRGVLSVALLGLAFTLTHQASWAAAGTALGYLIAFVGYDLPLTRRQTAGQSWWIPTWGALTELARLTWPLGVAVGLIALNASLPRYFLGQQRGVAAVGLFSALSYVTVAGSMVVTALGQAATAPLARLVETGQTAAFRGLLGRLLLGGVGLGAAGVLLSAELGAPLLGLLYGPSYAAEAPLFVLLMAAAGLSYVASFAGFGMTALREFAVQVPLFLVTTLSLLLGCWLWIPVAGLSGAAWALALSSGVQLLGSLWVVWRALERGKPLRAARL
jgi:O-antigen/teichoic acid export membrane protein